jgi:hypothetical protein
MPVPENQTESPPRPPIPEGPRAVILPVAAAVLLAAPALIVRYLPMTDLPQHLAVASIVRNIDDPLFGFSEYYEVALHKSLYLLPYLLVVTLSYVVPLEIAMRWLVFAMLLVVPLGVLALLRARGRPALLMLLALPLVYNATVFWGFIHYNFAVGLSFFAIALYSRARRTPGSDLALAALCTAIVFIHMYGLLILFGYVTLSVLLEERRDLFRRALPLTPGVIGLAVWIRFAVRARQVDVVESPGLVQRLTTFEDATLGGYRDPSETVLLIAYAMVFLFLCLSSLRFGARRPSAFEHHDRVFGVYIALNLVLYLVLPLSLPAAKCIYLRHSVLALLFLPLLVPAGSLRRFPRLARALLVALALCTIGNNWYHILRFDHEAEGFDDVLLYIEQSPRLLAVSLDNSGAYHRTYPYLHYASYVQARKGGIVSMSFASFAWIAPVRERAEANVPVTPDAFEWRPILYDYERFGYFYDLVLLRSPVPLNLPKASFPYHLVHGSPPWWLYRKDVDAPKVEDPG